VEAREGIVILVGFEAFTDRGHYLAFVPDPTTLPEICAWLRQDADGRIAYASLREAVEGRDGLLIAAHPFDRSIPGSPGDGLVQLGGVAAVEVLNGRRAALCNEVAEEVAAGVGLPGTGGSDVRTRLEEMGASATLVHGTVKNESDLIDRIRAHDVWPVSIGGVLERHDGGEHRPPRPRREDGQRPPPRDDRGGEDRRGRGGDRERSRYGRRDRGGPPGRGQPDAAGRPAGDGPGDDPRRRRPRRRGPKPDSHR
jgi:hypothetical protein